MNTRRWIAVLIAIGVALISLSGIAINSVNDSQEEALSSLLSSQESLKVHQVIVVKKLLKLPLTG